MNGGYVGFLCRALVSIPGMFKRFGYEMAERLQHDTAPPGLERFYTSYPH